MLIAYAEKLLGSLVQGCVVKAAIVTHFQDHDGGADQIKHVFEISEIQP